MVKYWYASRCSRWRIYLLIKLIRLSQAGDYVLDRADALDPDHRAADREDHRRPDDADAGHAGQSGVPILEALNIVRETAGNAVFERMFQRVYESIREGETIAEPLQGEPAGRRHGGEHGRRRRGDRRPRHDAQQDRRHLRRGGGQRWSKSLIGCSSRS